MIAAAVSAIVLLAADPAAIVDRAAVARSFACPAGTDVMGAAPPEGLERWCERPDELPPRRRHGPARSWYDDGELARAMTFDHGSLEGDFLEWHRNGLLARIGSFHAGEREGTWVTFYESGRREEECAYLHGARHGAFSTWWPAGRLRVQGRYCHGLQCGTWITWDEAGRELGRVKYEEIRATP